MWKICNYTFCCLVKYELYNENTNDYFFIPIYLHNKDILIQTTKIFIPFGLKSYNQNVKSQEEFQEKLRIEYKDNGSIEQMKRMTDTVITRVYNEPKIYKEANKIKK